MLGGGVVLEGGLENVVDVFLRVAVDQREPSALDLDHDPMAGLKGVMHILQRKVDGFDLSGGKGLGILVAVAEPAADDFAAHHLLIAGKGLSCFLGVPGWIALVSVLVNGLTLAEFGGVLVVVGIDVDQFHDPVGVGLGGGDAEVGFEIAGDTQRRGQRCGLVGQDIVAGCCESLVVGHVGAWGESEFDFLFLAVGDGVEGVTGEAVEGLVGLGGGAERSVACQMEGQGLGVFWWPGRVFFPLLGAGVKHQRFEIGSAGSAF